MPANPPFSLALITGASSGIGLGMAKLLASKGIPLILNGRDLNRLNELAKELCSQVHVEIIAGDLTLTEDRLKVLEAIRQRRPTLLINSAGFGAYGEAISLSIEMQCQMVELNDVALLELTLTAAKELVASSQKGVIMNISSTAAFLPFPLFAVYAATKAFVNSLSEALDFELKEKGVRVLAACPGVVKTAFAERAGGQLDERSEMLALSIEYSVQQIWKQIENEKPIHLFSPLYQFLVRGIQCLPKFITIPLLKKQIEGRLK